MVFPRRARTTRRRSPSATRGSRSWRARSRRRPESPRARRRSARRWTSCAAGATRSASASSSSSPGAQRQGRPRPPRRSRQRRREAQGRGTLALLGLSRPRARGRDGPAERRRRRGRRVHADEPLAQDRRPSRERGVTDGQQHRLHQELHGRPGRGLQEGCVLDVPEQPPPYGARGATPRRSWSRRSRSPGSGTTRATWATRRARSPKSSRPR